MIESQMYSEAVSAPGHIARQLERNAALMTEIAAELQQRQPVGGVTVARGSSDHAAAYFSYLYMLRAGIPVTSLPMSLTTLFHAPWRLEKYFALAVSQSGQSTDIIKTLESLKKGGAYTLSMVNASDSPLAAVSTKNIPLHAGEEQSVAATKSYIASLAASAQLLAYWLADEALKEKLKSLPHILKAACDIRWQKAVDILAKEEQMVVVGRGVGLAIAQEAALKFKEVCGIQAEAFSGAEIKHGPMALIGENYPILIFALPGSEQKELLALANEFRCRKAKVLLAADESVAERDLDIAPVMDFSLSPISVIQTFYIMVESLARARGLDPDKPRFLNKVTITV